MRRILYSIIAIWLVSIHGLSAQVDTIVTLSGELGSLGGDFEFVYESGQVVSFPRLTWAGELLYYPPLVTTDSVPVATVNGTSATVYGNVVFNGWHEVVTAQGFQICPALDFSTGVQSMLVTPDNGYAFCDMPCDHNSYHYTFTGLSLGTTYYVRSYATNASGTSYGTVVAVTTQSYIPTVTASVSGNSITSTSATITCNVTSDGGSSVTARGICWGITSSPTVSGSHTENGAGTGSFSSALTGLSSNTTYYVRAYATNTVGTGYSSAVSFTTAKTPPVATTSAATNITSTSATLKGTISNPDNVTITAQGFQWRTTANGTYTNVSATGSTISYNLAGLDANTNYTYRAFVTTASGTVYGSERTFTTSMPAVISAIPCTTSGHPAQTAALGYTVSGANHGLETVVNNKINSVTDYDGNEYPVVQIGNQCWLAENMRCTHSPSTGTYIVNNQFSNNAGTQIANTYTGKMARWYNNNEATYSANKYGLLYNWNAAVDVYNTTYGELSISNISTQAVSQTFTGNRQGICPRGWHVPTDAEWNTMEASVCGSGCNVNWETTTSYRGNHAGKLATGNSWHSSNTSGTPGKHGDPQRNSSGFSALPAGCWSNSVFNEGDDGLSTYFWTSTNYSLPNAYYRRLSYNYTGVFRGTLYKYNGYSVRCLRD